MPLLPFIDFLELLCHPEVDELLHLLHLFQQDVIEHDLEEIFVPIDTVIGPHIRLLILVLFLGLVESVEGVCVADLVAIPLFQVALVRVEESP